MHCELEWTSITIGLYRSTIKMQEAGTEFSNSIHTHVKTKSTTHHLKFHKKQFFPISITIVLYMSSIKMQEAWTEFSNPIHTHVKPHQVHITKNITKSIFFSISHPPLLGWNYDITFTCYFKHRILFYAHHTKFPIVKISFRFKIFLNLKFSLACPDISFPVNY